jgi:hypothetical protein
MTRRVKNVLLILMLTSEKLFDDVDDMCGISPGWGTRLHPFIWPVHGGLFRSGNHRSAAEDLLRDRSEINIHVPMSRSGRREYGRCFRYHLPSGKKLFEVCIVFSQRFFFLEASARRNPERCTCVNDSSKGRYSLKKGETGSQKEFVLLRRENAHRL